jgi:transposase
MTAERIESVLFAWVLKKRRLASFSSSLMDSEWEIGRELIPESQLGRAWQGGILDGIFHLIRSGIPWRMTPARSRDSIQSKFPSTRPSRLRFSARSSF